MYLILQSTPTYVNEMAGYSEIAQMLELSASQSQHETHYLVMAAKFDLKNSILSLMMWLQRL